MPKRSGGARLSLKHHLHLDFGLHSKVRKLGHLIFTRVLLYKVPVDPVQILDQLFEDLLVREGVRYVLQALVCQVDPVLAAGLRDVGLQKAYRVFFGASQHI